MFGLIKQKIINVLTNQAKNNNSDNIHFDKCLSKKKPLYKTDMLNSKGKNS